MSRTVAIAVIGLVLAGTAWGEVVHMRDGRKFVGKVTREGDKYRIEMDYGTISVDAADVIYVLQGGTTRPRRTTSWPTGPSRPRVVVRPQARWQINQATRPEPIVFMLSRHLELLGDDASTDTTSRQLEQWKAVLHDGKRKVGDKWLSRDEQRRRRSEFEKRVAAARKLASEARRYAWAKTAAEKAKGRRLEQEAVQALYAAATVWPDTILREFMAATLDLRAKNFERAEQRFERCIEAEPLVGAFHQGRGIALIGLRQHLEALEEFIVCLQLREDSFASLHFLQEAMKVTPGAEIKDPVYLGAKQLLAEYETPSRTYRSYGKGVAWLMPRRAWQARDDTIFTPPYDRLVSKQALGVPLTEGVLLVDADAIAGAELIYVQAGGDQFVLADPIRSYSMGKSEIPLTAIRVSRVSFTPVAVDKPAELKVGQLVTIRAANLYRQMGTDLRTGTAEVTAAGPEGVSLTKTLLPGEPVGAAFAGEAFAGFLTARCQPEGDGCGKSTFIQPSKLSEWAGRIKRTVAGRAGYRPYGRPKLKESVEAKPVDGQVFLVHILLGEKPPKEFGK